MNDATIIKLLTVSDVANEVERTPQFVRGWVRSNRIPMQYRLQIMRLAGTRGLDLNNENFLTGRNQ
ncbi:MAG: hypothetical protein OXF20_07475 [Gammaproteobacteria bacterium]|nr:hypothetical protein [Gammaproteobacteria bacterium]